MSVPSCSSRGDVTLPGELVPKQWAWRADLSALFLFPARASSLVFCFSVSISEHVSYSSDLFS